MATVDLEAVEPGYVSCRRKSRRFDIVHQIELATYGNMDWMSVQSDGLAVAIVMGSEGALHVLKCSRIVNGGSAVGCIPRGVCT